MRGRVHVLISALACQDTHLCHLKAVEQGLRLLYRGDVCNGIRLVGLERHHLEAFSTPAATASVTTEAPFAFAVVQQAQDSSLPRERRAKMHQIVGAPITVALRARRVRNLFAVLDKLPFVLLIVRRFAVMRHHPRLHLRDFRGHTRPMERHAWRLARPSVGAIPPLTSATAIDLRAESVGLHVVARLYRLVIIVDLTVHVPASHALCHVVSRLRLILRSAVWRWPLLPAIHLILTRFLDDHRRDVV